MKIATITAGILLLGTLTLGISDTLIDAQIEAIQNASPEDRVELVNEFKTTIANLSEEERAEAIAQLRTTMQANAVQTQTQTQTQTQAQVRERIRVNQMDNTMMEEGVQKMNQNRAASQAMGQERLSGQGTQGAGKTPNNFMGNR